MRDKAMVLVLLVLLVGLSLWLSDSRPNRSEHLTRIKCQTFSLHGTKACIDNKRAIRTKELMRGKHGPTIGPDKSKF